MGSGARSWTPRDWKTVGGRRLDGLSFGGSYASRQSDGGHVRYAAQPWSCPWPTSPACPPPLHPGEGRRLRGREGVQAEAQSAQRKAKKVAARSDTTPRKVRINAGRRVCRRAKKKYPIDTEKHIRAAWNFIDREKDAARCGRRPVGHQNQVIDAWKAKIDQDRPPSAEKTVRSSKFKVRSSETGNRKPKPKIVFKRASIRSAFCPAHRKLLSDMADGMDWEAVQEIDDSPLPGQFKEWLTQGCEILKAMAAEEVDELLADLSKATGETPRLPALNKAGARHSAADQELVQRSTTTPRPWAPNAPAPRRRPRIPTWPKP